MSEAADSAFRRIEIANQIASRFALAGPTERAVRKELETLVEERNEALRRQREMQIEIGGLRRSYGQARRDLRREDLAHDATVGQRDAAEEALSRAYTLVMGVEPHWSNNFGFVEALHEMEEKLSDG